MSALPIERNTAIDGIPDLPDRFWRRVDISGECWLWIGSVTANGYGKIQLEGKQCYAHRAAYDSLVGPIPEGSFVDHMCHVKRCVRPDHLQLADNQANAQNRAGAQQNSKSGVRGVHAFRGKWRVQVKADGRLHNGGVFADLGEAERAAVALRNRMMFNNLADRR